MKMIQYWHQGQRSSEIAELMQSWPDMNPSISYVLHDRESAVEYLKDRFGSNLASSFSDITLPAMASDVFRVAWILCEGGIYVDAATRCLKPIAEWPIDINHLVLMRKWHGGICNGLISSPANHWVLGSIWQSITKVLEQRVDGDIWELTGPGIFNQILKKVSDSEEEGSIQVVDQQSFSTNFQLVNKLDHKKRAHWSRLQKVLPLFKLEKTPSQLQYRKTDTLCKCKLVFHIGQHKTGSTAIQQAMVRTELPDDILYPNTGRKYSGHHGLFDQLRNPKCDIEELTGKLVTEVNASGARTVVLSSEYFSSQDELRFDKASAMRIWQRMSYIANCFSESEVIYYVRSQTEAIESRINQAIKSRLCLASVKPRMFMNNPTLDYLVFDEALRYFFPNCLISAVAYQVDKFPNNDICEDFSNRVEGLILRSRGRANPPIVNHDAIKECLRINASNMSVDEKMVAKNSVLSSDDIRSMRDKVSDSFLSQNEIDEIKKQYELSNQLFAERYPSVGNIQNIPVHYSNSVS